MKVFAHRGASGDYPENTILAFDKALALDVYGIELDVHKSKDGHLVVIHDEDIQRTFKGKGLVMDYTLSELKKFNCRKFEFIENLNCKIPTLREVFELIKNTDIILNIEAKTDLIHYDLEQDVIDLIKEFNATPVGVGVLVTTKEPVEKLVKDYLAFLVLNGVDEHTKIADIAPL